MLMLVWEANVGSEYQVMLVANLQTDLRSFTVNIYIYIYIPVCEHSMKTPKSNS